MNEIATIEIPEFLPITKQSGIEKAETYAATFAPFMITLKELSDKTRGINKETPSVTDAKIAREVRLALVKNRTATGKKKDESKAVLLAEGSLIQNLHNVVVNTSQLIEADLEAVEKYAENKERERIEALRVERVSQLAPFVEFDANQLSLGTMTADEFATTLQAYQLAHEKKIEDARIAEETRIKEENTRLEEQKIIREENEKMKAEQEKKDCEYKAKLAEIEANNKKAREKAAKEQAAKDKAAADEFAKQKAIANKLALELKEKQDADRKEQEKKDKELAEKLAAEKKAAKAPIKEKLKVAVTALDLKIPESEISADILAKFNGFKTWALTQINSL